MEEKPKYELKEIPTQTGLVIADGDNHLSVEQAIVEILNNQEKILKMMK